MTDTQSYRKAIDRIADSWCERNRPESMNTDWGQTLLAYGLLQAHRTTGNEKAKEYLRRWITYHLSAGIHLTYFVGSWSPGLLYPDLITLFPEHEHALLDVGERIYTVIRQKAIRNGDGVILHNVDLPHIYIDTIYYTAPVLAKLGTLLGRTDWVEDALAQLQSHLVILNDPETDFSIHCEQNLSGLRSEGAWARGNGWVAMTCGELLPFLKDHPTEHGIVANILRSLTDRLLPFQTTNGLWRTIITDESSYEETSASAMFLFGLLRGRSHGILSDEYDGAIARCLGGLLDHVHEDGRFLGVSEGTWPGTVEYYKGLEQGEWWWGTGSMLLALAEVVSEMEE